jgi:hypothetical protein
MAESTQYMFSHKEVVESLIKRLDLHEGIWGLRVEFGLGAANVALPESERMPAAIVPVMKIGLSRGTELDNLSADAAQVNPAPPRPSRRKDKAATS